MDDQTSPAAPEPAGSQHPSLPGQPSAAHATSAQPTAAYPAGAYPAAQPPPPGQAMPPHPAGYSSAAYGAAPAPQRSHAGVIIGSIVGGLLLLGLVFAGGAAVGYWVGAHRAGDGMRVSYMDGGPHDGWYPPQPGHPRDRDGREGPDDSGGDQNVPDDQSSPTP